jgi:O-antigen/teichoic acid export membrane protein
VNWLRRIAEFIEKSTGVKLLGRPVLRKILENTAYLSIGNAVSKLVTFLILIFIARSLGPESYGSYSTIVALVGMFVLVANFGLEPIIIREGSKQRSRLREFVSEYFPLKIVLSLFAFVLLLATLAVTGYAFNFKLLALLYGITLIFTSSAETFRYIFNITQDMRMIALASMGERFVFAAATLLLLPVVGGIKAIIVAAIISTGLQLVWYFLQSKNALGGYPSIHPRLAEWKQLLDYSKYFAASGLLSISFNQLNVVLVSSLANMSQAGLFAAANNLLTGFLIPVQAIQSALLPVSSAQFKSKSYFADLRWKVLRGTGIVVLGCVALSIASGFLVNVFFGPDFLQSVPVLIALIWMLPFFVLTIWSDQLLTATNQQRKYVVLAFIEAVVSISLSLWLIPTLGGTGAALSLLASKVAAVGSGWVFALRAFNKMS